MHGKWKRENTSGILPSDFACECHYATLRIHRGMLCTTSPVLELVGCCWLPRCLFSAPNLRKVCSCHYRKETQWARFLKFMGKSRGNVNSAGNSPLSFRSQYTRFNQQDRFVTPSSSLSIVLRVNFNNQPAFIFESTVGLKLHTNSNILRADLR